jgi:hypothetical protein
MAIQAILFIQRNFLLYGCLLKVQCSFPLALGEAYLTTTTRKYVESISYTSNMLVDLMYYVAYNIQDCAVTNHKIIKEETKKIWPINNKLIFEGPKALRHKFRTSP